VNEVPSPEVSPNNQRIWWLIGTHFVLADAPLLGIFFEPSMATMPLVWVFTSLPIGVIMTLSLWVGLGRTQLLWRLAVGLAATFCVALWAHVSTSSWMPEGVTAEPWLMSYLEEVVPYSILLVLFGGAFMLIGRRYQVVRVEPGREIASNERVQFSMMQIMLLMSAIAVVLSLVRASREMTARAPTEESFWGTVVIYSFMSVIFFINTACAAFAVLGFGRVKRNVAAVLAVSVLLGISMAIGMRQEVLENWIMFAASTLVTIVPTLTVVLSLLVVRSCGYRLVRGSTWSEPSKT
jgi:hypothetical protein